MSLDRRRVQFTTTGATGSGTLNCASDFIEVIGFRCISTGDATTRVGLVDADGRSLFLDAGDINYTVQKDTVISYDNTAPGAQTGIAIGPTDATGAALTLGVAAALPARNPITVNWSNGTSGDVVTFDLYYRYPLWKNSITLVVPGTPATVSGTLNLRSKFAQVVGFTALLTGTDTATRVQIADADSRTVYLDAADVDYKTAKIHRVFGQDDTLTGLTPQHLDATGVAATATAAAPYPVVRGPLTVSLVNGGTAADSIAIDVLYRTG